MRNRETAEEMVETSIDTSTHHSKVMLVNEDSLVQFDGYCRDLFHRRRHHHRRNQSTTVSHHLDTQSTTPLIVAF